MENRRPTARRGPGRAGGLPVSGDLVGADGWAMLEEFDRAIGAIDDAPPPRHTVTEFPSFTNPHPARIHAFETDAALFDYWSKATPFKGRKEDSPLISLARLRFGATRGTENVLGLSGYVLDCDNTLGKVQLPPSHRVSIQAAIDRLTDLGVSALVASSYSHTDEWERFRIVIPLDEEVTASHYRKLQPALMHLLGWPDAPAFDHKAGSDPARGWIPTLDTGTPPIVCRVPGSPISVSDLEVTLTEMEGERAQRSQPRPTRQAPASATKEAIRARLDMRAVLDAYGHQSEGKGRLPCFVPGSSHSKPSLSLSKDNAYWTCWGEHCVGARDAHGNVSGDIFAAIAYLEGLDPRRDFRRVLGIAAKHAGVELPSPTAPRPSEDEETVTVYPSSSWDKANAIRERIFRDEATGLDTLKHHRGEFLCWDGTRWEPLERPALQARVHSLVSGSHHYVQRKNRADQSWFEVPEPWTVKANDVRDIEATMAGAVHLPDSVETPSWLDERSGDDPTELIPCRNGLLSVTSGHLQPHTPAFFSRYSLGFDYTPAASRPSRWIRFLEELWGDDPACIGVLQEMFGLLLVPDTSYQKIFFLQGPKRSGKGTIGRVLRELLGHRNVASPTLASLKNDFGLEPLIGKTLALVSDARFSGTASEQQTVAERLLSISGEDPQSVNRKMRSFWHGTLTCRIVICSNELPRLADGSGALASRFVILPMTKSFYGQEDTGLLDSLRSELPGILLWALDGLRRLRERGRFHVPYTGQEMSRELEELGSPMLAFLREECRIGAEESVGKDAFFSRYRGWCERAHQPSYADAVIAKALLSACPEVRSVRPYDARGERYRAFMGVGLV